MNDDDDYYYDNDDDFYYVSTKHLFERLIRDTNELGPIFCKQRTPCTLFNQLLVTHLLLALPPGYVPVSANPLLRPYS